MLRIIVAGGRNFEDYTQLHTELTAYIAELCPTCQCDEVAIVSGAAAGADTLGARYAFLNHMPVHVYPAEWDVFGKQAGFRRNRVMAENADALLAFWDGNSKGTKNMIELMADRPHKVIYYPANKAAP